MSQLGSIMEDEGTKSLQRYGVHNCRLTKICWIIVNYNLITGDFKLSSNILRYLEFHKFYSNITRTRLVEI